MKKKIVILAALSAAYIIASSVAYAATDDRDKDMRAEIFEYRDGEVVCEGYIVYDETIKEKRPGVLVVHEWTGLGEYEKRRAKEIAEMGYVALAADIYGKGVRAHTPEEASSLAAKFSSDRAMLRSRASAALEALKNHPLVDPNRVAAIGYCFGGGTVLELARSGAELAGVVSFHGNLNTPNPEDAKNINCKVLALHGADDPLVPQEHVLAFQDEMRSGGVDWQMILYGGAVHSFTNPASGNDPSKGVAYNERADRRSWGAMKSFFAELFEVR